MKKLEMTFVSELFSYAFYTFLNESESNFDIDNLNMHLNKN